MSQYKKWSEVKAGDTIYQQRGICIPFKVTEVIAVNQAVSGVCLKLHLIDTTPEDKLRVEEDKVCRLHITMDQDDSSTSYNGIYFYTTLQEAEESFRNWEEEMLQNFRDNHAQFMQLHLLQRELNDKLNM